MENNKIAEEMNFDLENFTINDVNNNAVLGNLEPDSDMLNNLSKNEHDLHVIHNKRQELDSIQTDLDDLMCRLNSFIADSQEDCVDDEEAASMEDDDLNVTEKQDGPAEKELRLSSYATEESLVNKMYTTDDSHPPEINWDAVGPILQKHVTDLQRLHNLNQMTNAVVKRIKNMTQINDDILKETQNEHDT